MVKQQAVSTGLLIVGKSRLLFPCYVAFAISSINVDFPHLLCTGIFFQPPHPLRLYSGKQIVVKNFLTVLNLVTRGPTVVSFFFFLHYMIF